jgi:hypothetical protein
MMPATENQKLLFSFEDLGTKKDKTMKELSKIFAQAGTPVVDVAIDEKIKRVAGVSTRNITLTFADSQTITLSVKQSGDIYEVKVNNKVLPIKHQDNHKKAVIEMINALDAGRTKFQAALARTATTLPKSVKTAAPKMVDALKAELAEKQAAIEAADVRLAEIQSEIDREQKINAAYANRASRDSKILNRRLKDISKLANSLGYTSVNYNENTDSYSIETPDGKRLREGDVLSYSQATKWLKKEIS